MDTAKIALPPAETAPKDVRLDLAARLVALFPGFSQEIYAELYAYTVQVLGNIALEEVLKIRKALQGTLKDFACLPPKIAEDLTREAEHRISEPVLRFCAGLSDKDLKHILQNHPQARRTKITASGKLGYEPVLTGEPIQATLPVNYKETNSWLRLIVDQARHVSALQRHPIGGQNTVPASVSRRLERFVDKAIEDLLIEREDLDYSMSYDIAAIVRRRMNYAAAREGFSAVDYLKQQIQDGEIDENVIADALAMQDYAFVWAALAYKAETSLHNVQRVFAMKTAKPIVALCWLAGVSMRLAFQLQKDAGFVLPQDLIYPKDGSDYPLSEDNIKWQLEFLGLKVA